MSGFKFCTPHQIFCVRSNQEKKMGGACSTFGGTGEGHVGFGWCKLKERVHLEYLDLDGNLVFKMDLKGIGWGLELDWSGSR
jgi:hypothetical protein